MSDPSKGYWKPNMAPYQKAMFDKLTVSLGAMFKFQPWFPEVADSNSLRCCHGLTEAPRCCRKAEFLTLDGYAIWDGDAWCRDHRPVKKRGSHWIPLRCRRVER